MQDQNIGQAMIEWFSQPSYWRQKPGTHKLKNRRKRLKHLNRTINPHADKTHHIFLDNYVCMRTHVIIAKDTICNN